MLPRTSRPTGRAPRIVAVLSAVAIATLGAACACPTAAHADLGIGPTVPLANEPIRALLTQDQVAAADNGAVTLFVWRDARRGDADVFAARVAHDGTVLDPNGIEVASGPGAQGEPTVAWNGSTWLVAWSDDASGDPDVRAARIDPAGEVLDTPAIDVAAGAGLLEGQPALVFVDGRHLLVWSESTGGPTPVRTLRGTTLADDATVLGPAVALTTSGADDQPSLAVLGTTALLVFRSVRAGNADVYAARIQGAAAAPTVLRLDPADLALSTGADAEEAPAVAASAGGWLVAWQDGRDVPTSGVDIYGRRVQPDGTLLDAGGIDIATEPGDDARPAVTHNGAAWLVTWSQAGTGQFLRQVASNGNPAPARLDVSTAPGVLGDGAFGGPAANPFVAWSDPEPVPASAPGAQDVVARPVGAGPVLGGAVALTSQTPNQTEPALAYSGARWLVAWTDDRAGATARQVRIGVTVGPEFTTLDPGTIVAAAARPGLDQGQPAVAWDGRNFNVLWSEERGGHRRIVGARYSPTGAFVDSFTVSSGPWSQVEPAAVHTPGSDHLLVVWSDARGATRDLWARSLRDGVALHAEYQLVDGATTAEARPRLARQGSYGACLVFERKVDGTRGTIAIAFFQPDFPALAFDFAVADEPGRDFEAPQVATNGEDWLITYHELFDNDGPILHIPYSRWYGGGYFGLYPPQQLGPGSYVPANPVPASAGYNFVTTWSSLAAGVTDLYARSAGELGLPAPPAPLPVTADPPVDVAGAAAQGEGDRVGFAFLRAQDDGQWSGLRLMGGGARDTLVGKIVINEFLANPPSGVPEFYELFNRSATNYLLKGWKLVINGVENTVADCNLDRRLPAGDASSGGGAGSGTLGTPCSELGGGAFFFDNQLFFYPEFPGEGKIPNRHGRLQLFSPGGVLVDQVAYGDSGSAPVVAGIPTGSFPRLPAFGPMSEGGRTALPGVLAPGDSIGVSTSRIPNGTDTDNDAYDFNITPTNTQEAANVGTTAAPGTKLFITRVYARGGPGEDAVELFNPSSEMTFDFTNWWLSDGEALEKIGVTNNAWGRMPPGDKRVLRQGERGSFTFSLDYDDVLYLYDETLSRVEQIAWWRSDGAWPADSCQTRFPETGGFHDGSSWFTSGGQDNYTSGEVRYLPCIINAPQVDVPPVGGAGALAFRGAMPNPASAATGGSVLAFTVPAVPGGRTAVRLRLFDVAGRLRAVVVDEPLEAGDHRVPLAARDAAGRVLGSGVYYAELEVGGRRLSRPVVIVP